MSDGPRAAGRDGAVLSSLVVLALVAACGQSTRSSRGDERETAVAGNAGRPPAGNAGSAGTGPGEHAGGGDAGEVTTFGQLDGFTREDGITDPGELVELKA